MTSLKQLLLEGKKHVSSFFSYFLSKDVKIRPITAMELDDALIQAAAGIRSREVLDMVVNLTLQITNTEKKKKITPEEYSELLKYRTTVDYWICYHAMKDFEDISYEDIANSNLEVHDIAIAVRNMSVASSETLYEYVQSVEGKYLMSIHYKLHVPLVNEAWNATNLQLHFLALDDVEFDNSETFSSKDLNDDPETTLMRFLNESRRHAGNFQH